MAGRLYHLSRKGILKREREVAQWCPTLGDPIDCSLPGSSLHGISQEEYWAGLSFPSPEGIPDPAIKPGSPSLADRLFTTEPPGKPLVISKMWRIVIWSG